MPRHHEIDPGQAAISGTVDADKNWRIFMLEMLGYKPEARVVLIVDVMRPLLFLPSLVNELVFQALARPF